MTTETPKPATHNPLLAFLTVLTASCFAFTLFVNSIGMSPIGQQMGLFTNTSPFRDDMRYIEVTPASWTFSIWGFIYTWQIIWLIYVIAAIFRKTPEGYALYANPQTESPLFYISYIINLGCNVAWLVIWDRLMIDWALIPIALLPFTLYICLVISHVRLNKSGNYLAKMGLQKDIWMTRLFIQNGLAFYATWVTIATLLNFAQVLAYRLGVEQSIASTVILSILAGELVLWFGLDVFVFDKFTRYQFSPYIVVIVALIGSIDKNYTPGTINSTSSILLLVLASLAGVVKICVLFYRHFTRPVPFSNNEYNFESEMKINTVSTVP